MKGAGRERRLRLEKTLSLTARWQFTTAISTAKEQVKGEKKREKKNRINNGLWKASRIVAAPSLNQVCR
jgi:hypothetical protein